MTINLEGKAALITGASSGIGKAAAIKLAEAGARVAVHYFQGKDRGEEVVRLIREQGGEAALFQADVTSLAEIDRLMSEVEAVFGKVDILFNNAGHLLRRVPNLDVTEEYYHQIMDLNLKSTVFMSQKVAKRMALTGGGKIINMASIAAHNGGGSGSGVYAASKAAVISFSKGLAKEVAAQNITVNLVSPGFIDDTNFHPQVTTEEGREATLATIPVGRPGYPDDVAGAVLYLASDLSDFLTGETIEINGGALMR